MAVTRAVNYATKAVKRSDKLSALELKFLQLRSAFHRGEAPRSTRMHIINKGARQ